MFGFFKSKIVDWIGVWLLILASLDISAQHKSASAETAIRRLQTQGEVAFQDGKHAEAMMYFKKAIALCIRHNNLPRYADLLIESSSIPYGQGNLSEAIQQCEKALQLLQKSPVDSIRFKAYSNLSFYHSLVFQTEQMQSYLEKAEQMLERQPYLASQTPGFVAAYYNQKGVYYNAAGDFIQATTNLEKALAVAKKYQLSGYLSTFTNNLSTQYENLGNTQKAIMLAKQALSLERTPYQQIVYTLNLGRYYLSLNKPKEAFKYLTQSQQIDDTYGRLNPDYFTESRITLYQNWGSYYAATQQVTKAIRSYDQAITLAQTYWGTKHPLLSVAYRVKAQLLENQGDLNGALVNYRHAINAVCLGTPVKELHDLPVIQEGVLSERELMYALVGQASVMGKFSNRDPFLQPAFETYKLALHLAERIRLNYDVSDAKLLFGQQISLVNEQALRIAYALYQKTHQYQYLKTAFTLTESTRASTLSDARREQTLKKTWVPKELLSKEEQLKKELTSTKLQLQQPNSRKEQDSLKLVLVEQELVLDKFRQQLLQRIPSRHRQSVESMSVDTVREKLLDQQTALLSYVMTEQDLFVFVITQLRVKWVRIPFGQAQKATLAALQQSLYDNPGLSPYKGHAAAQQGYQQLFRPLKPYLQDVQRLIIIRDKELNYLPFEILESTASGRDFLLRSYSIRYAYGASLTQVNASTPWTGGPNGILAMAPFSETSSQKNSFRDTSLLALPASREEIRSVGGLQYANRQATKQEFLDHYASSQIIHLATHARTDDKEAERSFIAFYPDSADYKLYTDELYNLSFNHTQMVVLSACETGRGRLHRGEGLMSLARGFLYGGCPSVVTTLWNAHDQTAAYLSERMYAHLRKGVPIDQALQLAKLDFFSSDMAALYDHPYYWANLVLIGDASVLYESKWATINRISAGFFLLSSIFLGLFLARYWQQHR
ncbi:hypothetical protein C5O19_14580 [Siphonobacter curvatus]|uniref:CHAT domain-containing protein n=1 Tax=Siphonobacter curvatus TaxID=2094562 RepID=A0A2S7ISX3_9BACT|nr:hypothetical protein C5O19_14580 [Siphonobacter curvatus]